MIPRPSSLDVASPADLQTVGLALLASAGGIPAEHSTALALVLLLAQLRDSGDEIPPGPHDTLPERVHRLLHLVIARVEAGMPAAEAAGVPDEANLAAFLAAIPLDWARLTCATKRDVDGGHDAFFAELTAQLDVALSDRREPQRWHGEQPS
jgi:hypothetical protein